MTVITEALMNLKSTPLTQVACLPAASLIMQDYLYLDPRILKQTPTTVVPKVSHVRSFAYRLGCLSL